MKNKMYSIIHLCVWMVVLISFMGCMEGTSYSSLPLTPDEYIATADKISEMTAASFVGLNEVSVTDRKNNIIKKELRVALIDPDPFPDEAEIKKILLLVKSKFSDTSAFDQYTVAQIKEDAKDKISTFKIDVIKSVTIAAKDL